MLTVVAVIGVGVVAGARQRAHRRRAGRLHLPHLPVPRADRRVHRDPRPDPDRGRRAAPGARRAGDPDRPAAADGVPWPCRTGRRRSTIDHVTLRLPAPPRRRHLRRGDAPVLIDVHVAIPAGQQVAVVGATGSGKTTLGRLLARFADPTAGRRARRRRAADATSRNDDLRTPARGRAAGAVPVRRHDRRQPRLRPARLVAAELAAAVDGARPRELAGRPARRSRHAWSASAARSCRPGSASWSR